MTTTATYQIITPDGVSFNLDADSAGCGYHIYGLENIGMAPVRAYTHQVPGQPGAVLDDLLDDVRTITVSHVATGGDVDGVFENMNDVLANYRYNRTLTLQPLRLRVTFNSKAADLYCYYGGMVTSKVDNIHALWGMNLVAYDPYWYSTSATTAPLTTWEALSVGRIVGRIDGLWSALGVSSSTGTIYDMKFDANGDLYVAGDFDNWAGVGAADNIAKYDMSAGTWGDVGAATPLNDLVSRVEIAANGDIYVVGNFTNAGGAGTADFIAVLKSGAADWSSITTGGVADGAVGALLLSSDDVLWVGGAFDNINGVAAEMVARYDISAGTWSAAAGLTGATTVYVLAEGQDGTIYAGGTFTNGGGDDDADYLAQWDGTAWSNVGGPLNGTVFSIRVAASGEIYVGGDFTTWNGQTVNYIAKWDGSAIYDLDGGVNATVYFIYIAENDLLYVHGIFTTAGGVAGYPYCATWNQNTWTKLPIAVSAGITSVSAAFTDDDDLFLSLFSAATGDIAYVPADNTVTYAGNVSYPPTLAISGAGTLYYVRNETTGVEVYTNLYIAPGETVTLDLGSPGEIPAGKTVSTDWRYRPGANNLLGKVLSPTALARFALAPAPIATAGANLISVYMDPDPVETGDAGAQLSGYENINGITSANSDDGVLYFSILADDGETGWHIDIYSDSARTVLVAHTANYTTTGAKALVADGASGLSGTVTVDLVETLDAELLSNPGFETAGGGAPDVWGSWLENVTDGALADEAVIFHTGAHSAKVTAGAALTTSVYQAGVVVPGTTYKLTFWTYGDGTNAARFNVYDVTNAAVIIPAASTGNTAAAWAQYALYVTAPAGCVFMRLRLYCAGTDTAVVYFDDASIKACTVGPAQFSVLFPIADMTYYNRYDSLQAAVD